MNSFIEHNYLCHYGIKGMKWGVRRYQNKDGTLTSAGRLRYDLKGLTENRTAFEFKEKMERAHKFSTEKNKDSTIDILSSRGDAYEEAIQFGKARKKLTAAIDKMDKRIENAKTDKQQDKLQSFKEYSMDFPYNDDADKNIREATIEVDKTGKAYVQKLVGFNLSDIDIRRVNYEINALSDTELDAVQQIIKHNLHRSDIGADWADDVEKRNKVNIKLT